MKRDALGISIFLISSSLYIQSRAICRDLAIEGLALYLLIFDFEILLAKGDRETNELLVYRAIFVYTPL